MGFATGLRAGTSVAGSWIDNYKENKREDIRNQLFKAKYDIDGQRAEHQAEGMALDQTADMIKSMSGNDISNEMLQQVKASGGKIDDQTYGIAWQMGQMFEGAKQRTQAWEDEGRILDAKQRKYENIVFRREEGNQRRDRNDKPFETDEEGNILPETVDTTSKWFNSLPKGYKRAVLESQGMKGIPSATYVPAKSNKVFQPKDTTGKTQSKANDKYFN